MNHIYRVIYNKTTGKTVVVSEKTKSQGKGKNKGSLTTIGSEILSQESSQIKKLTASIYSILTICISSIALAETSNETQIIADKNVTKQEQAVILKTASGLTQVNIQTPSRAGISKNQYSQFDIGTEGAILNNSRKHIKTELAGFVDGNPHLAQGEAKVILNQVNSNNPSQIKGYVEVAGKRAEVVIANPSGIQVDGGGFINAGNVRLAVANSETNQEKVSYQVGNGRVQVLGAGLDNRKADFTQVIARHVELNAPILADELQVITGNSYNTADGKTTITSKQGTQTATGRTMAVDISELGGMYANKITLINTEIDTLVNNKGQIFSGIGGFTLDSQGNLVNTGTISTQGKSNLNTKETTNSGTLSSKEQLVLNAQSLNNSGVILAENEFKGQITDTLYNQPSAQINATRLDIASKTLINDGEINQTGTQSLSITVQGELNNAGKIGYSSTANTNVNKTPPTSTPVVSTPITTPTTASGQGATQTVNNPSPIQHLSDGVIKTKDIKSTGKIQANGETDLTILTKLNNTGELNIRHLKVEGDTFKNTADIKAQTAHIHTKAVDNHHARLTASQMLSITTEQLNNTEGKLHSAKDANLQSTKKIDNTQGEILANRLLNINDNQINRLAVINANGTITAQDVSIQAKSLDNTGKLSATKDLSLQLNDNLLIERDLQAGNTLTIHTQGSVDNQKTIQAGSMIDMYAKQNIHNQGTINSHGLTHLKSEQNLSNTGTGKIYGNHVALAAKTLINTDANEVSAIVAARKRLDIGAKKIINQTQRETPQNSDSHSKLLSEGTLHIGSLLNDNYQAEGKAGSLDNLSANIESNGDMFIASNKITNKNLHIKTNIEQIGNEESKHTISFSNRTSSEHGAGEWGWNLKERLPDEYDPNLFQFNGVDNIYLKNKDGITVSLGRIWIDNYDKLRHYKTLIQYTDPSVIKSGGKISFDGNVDNLDSTILAQGDILTFNGNINNDSTDGVSYTLRDRHSIHRDWYHDGGIGGGGYTRDDWHSNTYNEKIHEKTFELPTTMTLSNQRVATLTDSVQDAHVKTTQAGIPSTTSTTMLLPSSSLYTTNPSHPDYVVQTDPDFTNYREWLSSDYMLKALQSNPNHIHKQIGDGYYQQRLIAEQVAGLTGRTYLSDYSHQEEQFKALMDAGIEFAKKFNITAGATLTSEQMSQLTKPMVWLQLKDITFDDGSQQKVYYPVVLMPSSYMTLQADGALVSAKNIIVDGKKIITNKGTILAQEDILLSGENVYLSGGSLKGNRIQVLAEQDIHHQGKIDANKSLALHAGQDINMTARTGLNSTSPAQIRIGNHQTDANQSSLVLKAGRDISLNNAQIDNESQGSTLVKADRNLHIGTVNTTSTQKTVWNQDNEQAQTKTTQHGSQINTQGHLRLQSGNELVVTGSSIDSESEVMLDAKNITVNHAIETDTYSDRFYSKNRKVLSSSSAKSQSEYNKTTAVSGQITGNKIFMSATDNIQITGSQVVSDDGTQLKAGKDVKIESAEESLDSQLAYSHGKSGLMGSGGIGVSIGKEKSTQKTTETSTTQVGSMVGSLRGNTTIIAKENYTQNASTVLSPVGDVNIVAGQVTISPKDNENQSTNSHTYEKKGITISANIPVVSSVQTALNTTRTIGQSSNDRINAMATANAAWQAKETAEEVGKLVQDASLQNLNPSVSISYGQQKSTSQSHTQSTTTQGSQVNAGGQVNIIATGGQNSSITIHGSDVAGKGGTHLSADHDITITAAKQTKTEDSTNASRGFSVGANISAVGPHSATIGANRGKGNSNSQTTTYIHSHVGDEQSQTTIKAGNHLTLKGAGVKGEEVIVTADKLTMSSVQDTATHHSKQQNISTSATFGAGASVSGDYGKSDIDASYQSVTEQTGIFAGDKGAKVTITGHTDITGAVITSTAKAEQTGQNQFTTGTLAISHLDNESRHDGDALGVGVGTNKGNVGIQGIGYGQDDNEQTSTTKGGIYTSNITITGKETQANLTGKSAQEIINDAKIDTTTTDYQKAKYQSINTLANGFDKEKVQKELDVQVQVTQSFDQNRREIRTQYATKAEAYREDAKQAREQGNTTLAKTLEEKANQIDDNLRLFDGITSVLYAPNSNGIVGDVARAVSPQVAYQIGQYFKQNNTEQSASHLLAHAILGAAVSYATGNNITTGTLSGASSEKAAPILATYLFGTNDPEKLTQEQKDTITSIISLGTAGIAYGVSDGSVADAVNASEVGKVGVEWNYFTPVRNEKSTNILDLNIKGDENYVIYALAEYMVSQGILGLENVPNFVYSDMVDGVQIQDADTKEIINKNPTEEDYRKEFNTGRIIGYDEFQTLIKKHPQAYNKLIEGISNKKTLDYIKSLGLQVAGGLSGVAVSFGQIGEPILHPIETAGALYQFATTEDKLLAIQMAVAMDLQNRQELLGLHHSNNDTFGVALETSKNTADALLVLASIHKAPKEIATLIPTLKQTGTVVFNGVKYTMGQGKIVAQKIISPNTNVNTDVPTSQNLPDVYGDGDLNNVYENQKQQTINSPYYESAVQNIDESRKGRENVNFDFERQKRIEHNSKLTTTVDGNLSVTHGLSYDSKKELDGIRAFLVENKKSVLNAKSKSPNNLTIATAEVIENNGSITNYLAVSGKAEAISSKISKDNFGREFVDISIDGNQTRYFIIRQSPSGVNQPYNYATPKGDNKFDNVNHAEEKLMGFLTQNQNISSVKLKVQNTDDEVQGLCKGCGGKYSESSYENKQNGSTLEDFSRKNTFKIHVEHGSTSQK